MSTKVNQDPVKNLNRKLEYFKIILKVLPNKRGSYILFVYAADGENK